MVYLSPGNIRMKIPTFSLPTTHSCPGATLTCMNWCYAKKAEKSYPKVLPCRIRNLNDSKREDFKDKMISLISKTNSNYIRIHESGDFYSQIYLDKWIDICKNFPEKTFLAYTQCYKLDYSKKPDNLIIYWTMWPDSRGLPETGLKAIVISKKGKCIGNYLSEPIGLKNAFKCKKEDGLGITCDKCLYCYKAKGDVIFEVH